MHYVTPGRSGVVVCRLCLGTMTFGREADEAASCAMVDRLLDAGGTYIADIYESGASEEITGRAQTDLVRDRKVRYAGASNFAGWHLVRAEPASQLPNNLGGVGWRLSQDHVALLDEVSAPPAVHPYDVIAEGRRTP
jgi:aryl-alcohol dehydrogenase-like predicted oxidoreductase